MKYLFFIILYFFPTALLAQDSTCHFLIDRINKGNPLSIELTYGSCFSKNEVLIKISDTSDTNTLRIVIERKVPVEYKIIKKIIENNDSSQVTTESFISNLTIIKNPLIFKFPQLPENQYYNIKADYVIDTFFNCNRGSVLIYLKNFERLGDNERLIKSGDMSFVALNGIFCNIQMKIGNVSKTYWLCDWYKIDEKLKELK